MPDFILAIDQGTTSSRAIVFDTKLRPKASAQKEFKQYFPNSGWVEHDPEEIWKSVLITCRSAIGKAKTSPKNIRAIGITNQRETTVVWDRKTGKAIHKAIVWQDRRTAEICAELKAQAHENLFKLRNNHDHDHRNRDHRKHNNCGGIDHGGDDVAF